MAPSSGGSFYVYPAASMGTITGTAVCQMPPYNSSMSCNEGLANATVFVWPTSGSTQHYYGTISPNGNFVIKNVPTGNYYIMIEGMSQDPGPQGVTVTSPNSGGNFVWYP